MAARLHTSYVKLPSVPIFNHIQRSCSTFLSLSLSHHRFLVLQIMLMYLNELWWILNGPRNKPTTVTRTAPCLIPSWRSVPWWVMICCGMKSLVATYQKCLKMAGKAFKKDGQIWEHNLELFDFGVVRAPILTDCKLATWGSAQWVSKPHQCRPFVQIGFKFFDALWGEVEAWAGWMQKLRCDAMQLAARYISGSYSSPVPLSYNMGLSQSCKPPRTSSVLRLLSWGTIFKGMVLCSRFKSHHSTPKTYGNLDKNKKHHHVKIRKNNVKWAKHGKTIAWIASFCHWAALDLSNAAGDGSLLMPRGWSQHRCFMCPSSFSGFLFCNLPSDLPMSTASSSASFWNMGSSISGKTKWFGSTTPTGWVFLTSQWPRTLPTNTSSHGIPSGVSGFIECVRLSENQGPPWALVPGLTAWNAAVENHGAESQYRKGLMSLMKGSWDRIENLSSTTSDCVQACSVTKRTVYCRKNGASSCS